MPLKFSIKLLLTCLSLTFFIENLYSQDSASSQDDGLWSLVMTKIANSPGLQRWNTTSHFPKDEIQKAWDEGFFVTSLDFEDNKWTLVSIKSTQLYAQNWFTRTTAKELFVDIRKYYEEGKRILSVSYGNGLWSAVMSKGSEFSGMQLAKEHLNGYPQAYITEKLNEGYFLSDIAYGSGDWITVFSKDNSTTAKMVYVDKNFPEQKIKEYWDFGYRINLIKHHSNQWILSMIKNPSYLEQVWRTRYVFPKDEIKEFWDKSYSITSISFKDNLTTTNPTTIAVPKPYTTPVNSNELIGQWYLTVDDYAGLDFSSDMYYSVFDDYNFTSIGGKNYYSVEDGLYFDFKYEFNSNVYPKYYDVVVYSGGKELARDRCIYKIESGILTTKCPSQDSMVGAKHFDQETGYDITRYER
jgi:hypothetical protein